MRSKLLAAGALMAAAMVSAHATPTSVEVKLEKALFADGTPLTGSFIITFDALGASVANNGFSFTTVRGLAQNGVDTLPGFVYNNLNASITLSPAHDRITIQNPPVWASVKYLLVIHFVDPVDTLNTTGYATDAFAIAGFANTLIRTSGECEPGTCTRATERVLISGNAFVAGIPEPASLSVLGMSLAVLGVLRRGAAA